MTTAILALAAGLALAPVLLAGHHLLNMAVGLAVVGMWLLGAPQAQMEVVRYTKATRPIQQFVEAVSQLKLTHHTIILSSPLRGLHVRGAVYVYHLDHPRTVWGTHKYRLPRSWGKKRALRWDPVSAHFRKVQ